MPPTVTAAEPVTSAAPGVASPGETDYHALNAMLNLYDADGKIQFEKDREAAHQYFREHVNQNTVFFHDLDEKLDYLIQQNYYEREVLDQYSRNFVKTPDRPRVRQEVPVPNVFGRVQVLHLVHVEDV